ncbi:DUF4436 family protein [Smaragdicoccus niigatensis]|uniref:DUF4436 family protein n=1 Tax=Smaragdicoccus niigatensis TaxID=359359 RepID=UPI00037FF200|nr:DUF4436 family protein [Smaragdicoccus niigatensis]
MTSPTKPGSRKRTWLIIGLIVAFCVGLEIFWFVFDEEPVSGGPAISKDEPVVRIDPTDIETTRNIINVQISFIPGNRLTGADNKLDETVTLEIDPISQPSDLRFAAGTVPGTITIPFSANGDPKKWPFDKYTIPFDVYLVTESGQNIPVTVEIVGLPAGFLHDQHESHHLAFSRPAGTVVSAFVLCAMLIAIAAMAVIVAAQTLRGRRPFYPPMMTWFAAMVFAVVPLRSLLPGAPPIGAWVDRLVVVWVLAALVVSMGVYARCWWKAG